MKSAIILFTFVIAIIQFCNAQQIFDWRPENRTGVSAETGLLKSWPAAGPKLLWTNLDLTRGNSTPSFGENKMYITGTKDADDILFALDMNGKILWQKVMGRAWNQSYPKSRAMPTVEGNRVYTCSGMGDLACFDGTTGDIIWSYKASGENQGTYGNWLNNANGKWCCIDWNTGKKKWEEAWNCKGSIISAEGMLYIYDEKKGNVGLLKATPEKFDLVSSFQITQGENGPFSAHPIIHNGILYLRHENALMAYDIKAK